MKHRFVKLTTIILLIIIGLFSLFIFSDQISYILFSINFKKEQKIRDEIFNKSQAEWKIREKIIYLTERQNYDELRYYLDSLVKLDTLYLEFRIKRGFALYKVREFNGAKTDFQFVFDRSYSILGNKILKNNDAIYNHSLIGLCVVNYILAKNDSTLGLVKKLYIENELFKKIVKLDTIDNNIIIKNVDIGDFMKNKYMN